MSLHLSKEISNAKLLCRPQVRLAEYTTFRLGGEAEFFVEVRSDEELLQWYTFIRERELPFLVLGGGANLLIHDRGVEGVTLFLGGLNRIERKKEGGQEFLIAEAGASVKDCSERASEWGLGGLDFIYGMPGTIGGAVYMNARCYGSEISDIFAWADYLTPEGRGERLSFDRSDWEYKKSPFQRSGSIITRVALRLSAKDPIQIRQTMEKNLRDREAKGHFLFPCGGSFFKNNRDFGEPSGVLIDRCGWRGSRLGGAGVLKEHANFLINLNKARAIEVDELATKIEKDVKNRFGFELEREVQLIGF